jgi:putative membrane protein
MMDWDWGWAWWLMMVPMMLLFWVVPIALVVWGMSASGMVNLRGGQRPPAVRETPLEILESRYARGELSDDEFEAMRRRLDRTDAMSGSPAGASRDAVRPGT